MKNRAWKVSNITLSFILNITLIIAVLFYCGGEVPETQRIVYDLTQPSFTDLLLFWMFFLLALTLVIIFTFGIYKYVKNYDESSRQRTLQLSSIGGLLLLLLATWLIGDGNPLKIPSYDGSFNTPFWLKTGDMWIYSITLLFVAAVALIVGFALRDYFSQRKGH